MMENHKFTSRVTAKYVEAETPLALNFETEECRTECFLNFNPNYIAQKLT